MKKKNIFRIMMFLFLLVLIDTTCFAATTRKYNFQFDRIITNKTSEFEVFFANDGGSVKHDYENAFLYVKKGQKTLFKAKCGIQGFMDVKIKKQSAGSVLKIYLKYPSGKKSNIKTVKVLDEKNILTEKPSKNIRSPRVKSKGSQWYISANKGNTVIIRNSKRVLKRIKFDKNGTKYVPDIDKYISKYDIYIYSTKKNYRSYNYTLIPKRFMILE